jgi:hypothetical protein
MKPLSERSRLALVAAALLCYVLGVVAMLPPDTMAKALVSDVGQVSPEVQPKVTLQKIPSLTRDPFALGLSSDADRASGEAGFTGAIDDATLPPVLNTNAPGQVPAIARGTCSVDVLGTFLGTDAQSGKPRLVARISESGGAAAPKSIGDLVCGDVVTAIGFDGVTVGDRHYSVERDTGGATYQQPVAGPTPTPTPSPTPTAAPAAFDSSAPSPSPAATARVIRQPRILHPDVKVTP